MDNIKGHTSNFLGFESVQDFTGSLFKPDDWAVNSFIGGIAATITAITGYIYYSPEAVYTLWAIMAFDWLTGVARAIKFKELISFKLFRMPIYFIATSLILSLSWWMAKSSSLFVLLPGIVLGGFYSVYFISLLENLSDLKLLPERLVYVIKRRFGLKYLSDKYFMDEPELDDYDEKEKA